MDEFKLYRRLQLSEMRPVTSNDIEHYQASRTIEKIPPFMEWRISISQTDLDNGSPKLGDMIARNPFIHSDEWLVAEKYFKENFETFKN